MALVQENRSRRKPMRHPQGPRCECRVFRGFSGLSDSVARGIAGMGTGTVVRSAGVVGPFGGARGSGASISETETGSFVPESAIVVDSFFEMDELEEEI